jgi:hypothetical protein
MTSLSRAIVNHDLQAIETALATDPSVAHTPENGWLPVQWAERTGNLVTLVRFLRVADERYSPLDPAALLTEYVDLLASDEYEPYTRPDAIEALWQDLFHGASHMVGRFKRPLVPSLGQAEDLRFLIAWLGADNSQELLRRLCR